MTCHDKHSGDIGGTSKAHASQFSGSARTFLIQSTARLREAMNHRKANEFVGSVSSKHFCFISHTASSYQILPNDTGRCRPWFGRRASKHTNR
jgi:hypothetical protein